MTVRSVGIHMVTMEPGDDTARARCRARCSCLWERSISHVQDSRALGRVRGPWITAATGLHSLWMEPPSCPLGGPGSHSKHCDGVNKVIRMTCQARLARLDPGMPLTSVRNAGVP